MLQNRPRRRPQDRFFRVGEGQTLHRKSGLFDVTGVAQGPVGDGFPMGKATAMKGDSLTDRGSAAGPLTASTQIEPHRLYQ